MILKKIMVNMRDKGYEVYIDNELKNLYYFIEEYKSSGNIFIITDDIVSSIYGDIIDQIEKKFKCKTWVLEHGEKNKSLDTVKKIYDFLLENNATRNSTIIGFGGGIVGDVAGFAASTYMREISFINVPTTMLSQIDSCIGGKVGFNYNGIKNLIGSFFNPKFVYVCPVLLKSLSRKQFKDGLGELIKYALIDSREFLNYIDSNFEKIISKDEEVLLYIIEKCLSIKRDVVTQDFRDTGLRNILNFGHTVGHAIEVSSNFDISHGEAVALGSLAAIKLSEYKFNISGNVYDFVVKLLERLELPVTYKINDYDSFLSTIGHDKKNDLNIRFVLLEDIGKCKIKIDVEKDEIVKALKESIDVL